MEVTLLEENQIFGENRLEIFDKCGTKAAITDFAILLGGYAYDNSYVDNIKKSENRTGLYWTKTIDSNYNAKVVFGDGRINHHSVYKRFIGVRPVLIVSNINEFLNKAKRNEKGILEVEYGYYPQKVASHELSLEMKEVIWKDNSIFKKTGYTTDSKKIDEYGVHFEKNLHHECEYKEKRYAIVIQDSSFFKNRTAILSNENVYNKNRVLGLSFIEVEPIKWLIDEKNNMLISEKILVSGLQFNRKKDNLNTFEETDLYKYLNAYFIKDIQQNIQKELEIKVEYEKSKQEIELENIEKAKQKILELKNKIK